MRIGRYGNTRAKVLSVAGSLKSEKAVSLIAIHMHGIPNLFPQNVLDEAASAKSVTLQGREDWRALPLITIDPADAKDHDDAVHAQPIWLKTTKEAMSSQSPLLMSPPISARARRWIAKH